MAKLLSSAQELQWTGLHNHVSSHYTHYLVTFVQSRKGRKLLAFGSSIEGPFQVTIQSQIWQVKPNYSATCISTAEGMGRGWTHGPSGNNVMKVVFEADLNTCS